MGFDFEGKNMQQKTKMFAEHWKSLNEEGKLPFNKKAEEETKKKIIENLKNLQ